MRRVAIIGAGELGSALAKILAGKADVAVWDVDPAKIPGMKPLRDVVSGADAVLCAVPSFAMRAAVSGLLPFVDTEKAVTVSLAKGIETPSKKFMDEVLAELIPGGRWAVMGGPMLAAELSAGRECAAVLASSSDTAGIREIFDGTNLRIEVSDDAHGVAVAGVLKNVYAVLMGIAAGFNVGEDETAVFATRAMEEMVLIGKKLGAREETICGTAGFADFLATAYSNHSRNRNAGIALAIDGGPVIKGEGILSLEPLVDLLGSDVSAFPLLSALVKIAMQHQNSRDSLHKILEGAE